MERKIKFMQYVRLKCSTSLTAVNDRLRYNPEILEFYLSNEDLEDEALLLDRISYVQSKGTKVYLHHPMIYKGLPQDILDPDMERRSYYLRSTEQLVRIGEARGVKVIVHAHYANTVSSYHSTLANLVKMRNRIDDILSFGRNTILWENTIEGIFSYDNEKLIEHLIEPLNLSLVVDISHTFISFKGDNEKLEETLERTFKYAHYYHVVDSDGQTDGLSLGKGSIDFRMVYPYIRNKEFIFEISLHNYDDCTPMIRSAEYFNKLVRENEFHIGLKPK
jgi:sugar phosphate isomerase/epimerase